MMNAANSQASEKLRQLQRAYLDDLRAIRTELRYFQERLEDGELTALGLGSLRRLAHKLAGSGGTYGFQKLSGYSRRVEHLAEAGTPTSVEPVRHALEALLREIDQLIGDAGAGAPAEARAPEAAPKPGPKKVEMRRFEQASPNKPKLLIVEDDPLAARLLTRLLGEEVDVRVADNGMDVLPQIKRERPDLIVLDNDLPGLSGLEILDVLHHHEDVRDVPVVMLTGSTDPRIASLAKKAGAEACFTKPFEPVSFAGRPRAMMAHKRDLVLIVDDDQAIRDLLAAKFTEQGVNTAEAEDGVRALQTLREMTPSLVILDRMMPGVGGDAVLDELQHLPNGRSVPVIVLTARTSSKDALDWLKRGAVDFVAKPFSPDMLIDRAMKAMGRTMK